MAIINYVEEISVEWTAGGTAYAKTFAQLNVEAAELIEAVRGGDWLSLTVIRAVDAAPLWMRGQRIRLRNESGKIFFHGWCKEPGASLKAASERHTYEFEPASRFLASTYTQYIPHHWDKLSPEVILNRLATQDGSNVSVAQVRVLTQTTDILDKAKATGNAGGAAPFTYDLTGLTDFDVPMNKKSSISFEEALKYELMWDPAIDWHWDCRGADPVLRLVRYDMSTTPPTVTGAAYADVRTLPNDGTVISEAAPKAVDGKLCSSIVITYQYEQLNVGTGNYDILYAQESATAANGSPTSLAMQVTLSQPTYVNGVFGNPEAKPSEGLAVRMMNACRAVLWQLNFSSATTGLRWEWRLGQLWNVSGMQSNQAAAYSTATRITRDLVKGVVRVETGPPSFLSMDDLLAILRVTRTNAQTPSQDQTSTMPHKTPPIAPPNGPQHTTTGAPGTDASVTASIADEQWSFDFVIPVGPRLPFDCRATAAMSGWNVDVVPGYFAGHAPTIGGVAINAGTPLLLIGTGTQVVYLKVQLTLQTANGYVYGSSFASALIDVDYTLPASDKAAGTYYFELATFVDGVKGTPQATLTNLSYYVEDTGDATSSATCYPIAA